MSEGSIGYYDSSSVLTELTSGSLNQVLTMGASVPSWATSSGGLSTLTRTTYSTSTTQTVTSLSYVTLTGFSHTLGAGAGMAICNFESSKIEGGQNGSMRWNFATDGVQPDLFVNDSGGHAVTCYAITETLSGQLTSMEAKVNGTGNIEFQGSSKTAVCYWLEIA